MNRVHLVLLMMLVAVVFTAVSVQSQDDGRIAISLTVPQFVEDVFRDEVIVQFETEHPNIHVHIVNPPGFGIPFTGDEPIEDYLDAVEDYVTSADVVLMDSETLLPEATRAGYFLDIYPLVNTDPTINSLDYHAPVWQSFQWDGGMWAVPVTMDATMIFYDRRAFDDANMAYPTEFWTMTDYENTVRALTQFDTDGNTIMPGWINSGGDFGTLFLAAISNTVIDYNVLPNMPRYDNPALEEVMAILARMYNDGLMDIPDDDAFDYEDVPLQLGRVAFNVTGFSFGGNPPKAPALLPGGRAGLVLDAFAISNGTQYPEAAYELLRFLSYSPEVANSFFGGVPARLSLEGTQDFPGGALAQQFFNRTPQEVEALIARGLQNSLSISEQRFAGVLEDAVTKMVLQGLDARAALDEVELEVLGRLQVADARRDTVNIVVEPPPPPIVLQPGEIRLSFGLTSFTNPPPNLSQWEELALAFVFNDAEVGDLVLDVTLPDTLEELTAEYDCFYLDANAIPSADLSLLRSLDPLLNSDPTFDRNDLVGDVLSQVQRNNQTWALPLMLQPASMRYNPVLFANAGAWPPGQNGWTVDQFEDALRMLKAYLPEGDPIYEPREFGNSYLLMLMAAYGGLPFDYRTDPPTLHFADPATVEAVRNVLDLAKDGYIDYRALASVSGFNFNFGDDADTALYSEVVSVFGDFGDGGPPGANGLADNNNADDYKNTMILFPRGSQYAAVSYDVGAAYISAVSQHAEACYRFMSALAQQPGLFPVMPARRSHINSFEVETSQGTEAVAFYNSMDVLMQQNTTINIPALQLSFDGIIKIFETFWLNRAFDRYVFQDADLLTELEDAELFTQAFIECEASIPPFDPMVDEPQTYFTQFASCAFRIDPSVLGFFNN